MHSRQKKSVAKISSLSKQVLGNSSGWKILLIIAVAFGTFLRFYRIEENIIFHGELGHNYLQIKNFIRIGKIPLLGPPTSHPWLSFGPLFYWIMSPILRVSNYDPRAGAYFMATIGALAIIINFFFIEKILGKRVAILSSFLLAISPAWINLTRQSRFFSLTAIFFYPFLYFLVSSLNLKSQSSKKKIQGKNLFWAGVFLGIMLNFHWSPLALIPASVTLLYLQNKKIRKENLAKACLGLIIANIPFILSSILNKFSMLSKLVAWIPYRLVGFVGLYPKNTISIQVIKKNLYSLYNFFQFSFFTKKSSASLILVIGILLFIVMIGKVKFQKKKKDWAWMTLILIFLWHYLSLFIHGDPPQHYYIAIYPIPILFLALMLDKLLEMSSGKLIVTVFLAMISIINAKFFFSQKWFYIPQNTINIAGAVPFNLQLLAAKTIIKDAKGNKFSLSRVGPFDYFEGNYAQNYQYLLWWLGNEPVDGSNLEYTIYEDVKKRPSFYSGKVFWLGNLAVLKK